MDAAIPAFASYDETAVVGDQGVCVCVRVVPVCVCLCVLGAGVGGYYSSVN